LNPEIWTISGIKRDELVHLTKHAEQQYNAIVSLMMADLAA